MNILPPGVRTPTSDEMKDGIKDMTDDDFKECANIFLKTCVALVAGGFAVGYIVSTTVHYYL